MVTSEPAKAEVATKAESLKAQAQSLEARAEAQNLQVRLPDVGHVWALVKWSLFSFASDADGRHFYSYLHIRGRNESVVSAMAQSRRP